MPPVNYHRPAAASTFLALNLLFEKEKECYFSINIVLGSRENERNQKF
jgi:hypothetical protein